MTLEVILSILAGSVAAGLVMSFCLTPVLRGIAAVRVQRKGALPLVFHKHNMLPPPSRSSCAFRAPARLPLRALLLLFGERACLPRFGRRPLSGLGVLYILSSRHALKVPLRRSARMMRLGGCCFVLVCALIFRRELRHVVCPRKPWKANFSASSALCR